MDMATIMTSMTSVVTTVTGFVTTIVGVVVGQPLLLIPIGLGLLGSGVALVKKFI